MLSPWERSHGRIKQVVPQTYWPRSNSLHPQPWDAGARQQHWAQGWGACSGWLLSQQERSSSRAARTTLISHKDFKTELCWIFMSSPPQPVKTVIRFDLKCTGTGCQGGGGSPALEVLQGRADVALRAVGWWQCCWEEEVGLDDLGGLFRPWWLHGSIPLPHEDNSTCHFSL